MATLHERRLKLLTSLKATAENEDDFSWEDDEGESVGAKEAAMSAKALASSQHTLIPPRATPASEVLSLPSSHAQSPRGSSEESYDVVSGSVSSAVEEEKGKKGKKEEDAEESDWE